MTMTEVLDVHVHPSTSKQLWGHHLDKPTAGSRTEVYSTYIEGWVLGRDGVDVIAVHVVHCGVILQRTPLNIRRPDVASKYPEVASAEHSGFRTAVSLLPIEPGVRQVLLVQAELCDGSCIDIGAITVRRRAIRPRFQPKLQPLLITTLGRSGSTWLTQLIGEHPQVVSYEPFKYEPRVTSYWMEVLRTLSEPASYVRSISTEVHQDNRYWWTGDGQTSVLPSLESEDVAMHRWLGREAIEELVSLCQSRVEAFYDQVISTQGRAEAAYFVERVYGSSPFAEKMMWELYSGVREIILVRDLRDVICSMFAFSKKTGTPILFGYEQADDDRQFVGQLGNHYRHLLSIWQERMDTAHLLRYEDLVSFPQDEVTSLLKYLDIGSDQDTVDCMLQAAAERAAKHLNRHQTATSQTASIGRWQQDMDPNLQVVCLETFGDVLEEFGYAK